MGGLIPLLLPRSASCRLSLSTNPTTPQNLETDRPATASSVMHPAMNSALKANHGRQQSLPTLKRRPMSPMAPPVLPILPYTPAEWKKAITEVKSKYMYRKYRACAARCCEILDTLREPSNVEALHLVYLHFYAASSFEMCARPLSRSSPFRAKLLRDARGHYEAANAQLAEAERLAAQPARSVSSTSSATSSTHSPSTSLSSPTSTASTALSSPRDSIIGVDIGGNPEEMRKPAKKRVAFSVHTKTLDMPQPGQKFSAGEPRIRPDSPTLGWEEDLVLFGHRDAQPDLSMPVPGIALEPSTPTHGLGSEPATPTLADSQNALEIPSFLSDSPGLGEDTLDLEAFLEAKNRNKFCTQLSALRDQLSWHCHTVDALLSKPEDTPPNAPSLPLPQLPSSPEKPRIPERSPARLVLAPPPLTRTNSSSSSSLETVDDDPLTPPSAQVSPGTLERALSEQLKLSFGDASSFDLGLGDPWDKTRVGRGRNGSNASSSYASSNTTAAAADRASSRPASAASTTRSHCGGDEALRERIERMRANGWQRKRFDNRRYAALREQVMSELQH